MIVWEKQLNNDYYSVRRAGHSLRLYKNKVFHSQYHENSFLNGGVWDLLWLPLLFRHRIHSEPNNLNNRPIKVLMLGVGAGAALKKINQFFSADITGIELDNNHIYIAETFFDLRGRNINLVNTDAINWLANYQGPPFDVIIDDLFFEIDGEPKRVIEMNDKVEAHNFDWIHLLESHMKKTGILITNTIKNAANRFHQSTYENNYRLLHARYDNKVIVSSQCELELTTYKKHLNQLKCLKGRIKARDMSELQAINLIKL